MQRLNYIGIKEDTGFRVVNGKLFKEELNRLPNGRYRITVQKYRKDKSHPQLGYLFTVVYPLSLKLLNDAGWEVASVEEVDVFWKTRFASKDIVNRNSGEITTIPDLKRNFTTSDMMGYIDAIRNFCAEYLGGYIPEPNEQTNLNFD